MHLNLALKKSERKYLGSIHSNWRFTENNEGLFPLAIEKITNQKENLNFFHPDILSWTQISFSASFGVEINIVFFLI